MQKCILIVDDNALVRRSLRTLFETHGWDVCGEAENGRDAIEMARRLQPKIILLDLSMPVMNGLEAALILSKEMPGIRLLMLTMLRDVQVDKAARAVGIKVVLSKSEDIATLVSRAEALLAEASQSG